MIASAQVYNLTIVDSSPYPAGISETILQASVVPGSQNGLISGPSVLEMNEILYE